MIIINSEEIIDRGNKNQKKIFFTPGGINSFKKKDSCLYINLDKAKIALKFLTEDIVRIIMAKREETIDFSTTHGVQEHDLNLHNFEVSEKENKIVVSTAKMKIEIRKDKFSISFYDENNELFHQDAVPGLGWFKNEVWAWKKFNEDEKIYGLGEKTGFLNKRGKKYSMWNTDVYETHVETTDPMYISIPFYIGFNNVKNYGIYFDNSYKTHFDFRENNNDNNYSFWAEGGKLDYYLINGNSIKDIIKKYTLLTGRMPLPPKWSLGYHQSKYSYKTEKEVRNVASKFREKNIPCDVIHLDIHYMDGYRVFTWDERRFPEPERLLSDLHEKGFKVVNIIDPGIKKDPQYNVYREGIEKDYFCQYLDGEIFSGDVWPGESVFPDFSREAVRKWWGDLHFDLLDKGVKGIWNDMNEPAVFNETYTMDEEVVHDNDKDPGLHKRFHNLYALLEAKATFNGIKKYNNKRPFVLSRAGFSGIQRYSACWTGDNRSFWNHLKLAIPMLLNMGLSGITFSGTDIGGFEENSSGELLTRWTQLGTFMPFFRNHSSINTIDQEPWAFGKKYENIIRKFIKLRYIFMPYIYNLFYEASETGLPIIRPLFLEFPKDTKTYELDYQFMVGENILVAPVYEKQKRKQLVYLPSGKWINYFNGKIYEGKQYIIEDAPLDSMPLYIKAGSIIPLSPVKNYISDTKIKEKIIEIYFDNNIKENKYTLYEDDGSSFSYKDGGYNLTEFSYITKENNIILNINKLHDRYDLKYKNYRIVCKGLTEKPNKIYYNQNVITNWEYNNKRNELKIIVGSTEEADITISF